MKKESKKFKVKSRDKQSKTTGVRHSDDDVKKAVVDRIFKIEQLNNIPKDMWRTIRIVRALQ